MGYVKEPEGIDFFVDPKPLTEKEKNEISELIAFYKKTGRKRRLAGQSAIHVSSNRRTKKQLVKE
ncbi:MAG TPA: hypothetical protein VIO15_06990 [Bacteroidales bacterium]